MARDPQARLDEIRRFLAGQRAAVGPAGIAPPDSPLLLFEEACLQSELDALAGRLTLESVLAPIDEPSPPSTVAAADTAEIIRLSDYRRN